MEPSAGEIRTQLDRVLASEGFANADRMSAFLRYVVERALAGESDQIKEYAIGVDVFGRNGAYDPRLDSIVRVEARRLRGKVDEYYTGLGANDPVVIRLRRGSYVPAFEHRPDAPAAAAPVAAPASTRSVGWPIGIAVLACTLLLVAIAASRGNLWAIAGRPSPSVSIAVLPFLQYSTDDAERRLAARLTDGVTSELARLGTIGVVSHTSALQFAGARKPAPEIGRALNADIIMEGTVSESGERVSVSIRLVNAHTDRKAWVRDFEGRTADVRELQRRIAAEAAPFVLASRPK